MGLILWRNSSCFYHAVPNKQKDTVLVQKAELENDPVPHRGRRSRSDTAAALQVVGVQSFFALLKDPSAGQMLSDKGALTRGLWLKDRSSNQDADLLPT